MLNFRCIGNFPLYKYIEFPARNRLVAQAKKAQASKCLSFFRCSTQFCATVRTNCDAMQVT